jgi:hypothetical protein
MRVGVATRFVVAAVRYQDAGGVRRRWGQSCIAVLVSRASVGRDVEGAARRRSVTAHAVRGARCPLAASPGRRWRQTSVGQSCIAATDVVRSVAPPSAVTSKALRADAQLQPMQFAVPVPAVCLQLVTATHVA